MAINKSKARKIKRRLAYFYFPVVFAIIGFFFAQLMLKTIVPTYRDYRGMAFGDPPAFSEQIDKKSFLAYEGKELSTFNNISVTLPAINQQYAELVCKELDIEAPVFWSESKLALKSGVGTYEGSNLPGYGKDILMSAHNTTYFKGLKNVKTGDVFTLTTTYAKFRYEVKDIKILKADDASAVNYNASKETLVLYTCYPFNALSSVSEQRMFVYCEKIAGPTVKNWEVDL